MILLWLLGKIHHTAVSLSTTRSLTQRPSSKRTTTSALALSKHVPTTNTNTSSSSSLTEESCPFSIKFPRYRVDLTTTTRSSSKSKRNNHKSWWSFLFPTISHASSSSWWNKQQRQQQQVIEKRYSKKDPNHTTTVQWYNGSTATTDELVLEIWTKLWQVASAMTLSTPTISDDSTTSTTTVLVFPNLDDTLILQQWMEVLDWIQTNKNNINNKKKDAVVRLNVTLVDDSLEIPPLLEMTVTKSKIHTLPTTTTTTTTQQPQPRWDPAIIEQQMKAWVNRVLVQMKICPFTKSTTMSGQGLANLGVPVARIVYHTSQASPTDDYHMIHIMSDAWTAIQNMVEAGPQGRDGISSILMAAPSYNEDLMEWLPVFALLEAGILATKLPEQIGVVCFHPKYLTPDGSNFPGFGHMHSVPRLQGWVQAQLDDNDRTASKGNQNPDTLSPLAASLTVTDIAAGGAWQRRTPHATINVLRADQLQAAEGKRDSKQMYTRNICTLLEVGNDELQQALEREQRLGL